MVSSRDPTSPDSYETKPATEPGTAEKPPARSSTRKGRTTIRVPADDVPRTVQTPLPEFDVDESSNPDSIPLYVSVPPREEGENQPPVGPNDDTRVDHDIRALDFENRGPSLADYGLSVDEEEALEEAEEEPDQVAADEQSHSIQIEIGDEDEPNTRPHDDDIRPTDPDLDDHEIRPRESTQAVRRSPDGSHAFGEKNRVREHDREPTVPLEVAPVPMPQEEPSGQLPAGSQAPAVQEPSDGAATPPTRATPPPPAAAFGDQDRTTAVTPAPAQKTVVGGFLRR